jgi:hypothetical protein
MLLFDPRLVIIIAIAGLFWGLGLGATWLFGLQGSMVRTRLIGVGLLIGASCYYATAPKGEGPRHAHDISWGLWGGSVLLGATLLFPPPIFIAFVVLGVTLLVLPRRAARELGRFMGALARKIRIR